MQMKPELLVLSNEAALSKDMLAKKIVSPSVSGEMLPESFTPGEHDVICQRGKDSFEHIGNKRFRKLIDIHIKSYHGAHSRRAKTGIVTNIFHQIQMNATQPSGGFVKKDLLTRRWCQVSEKEARDKVGQALRDAIKNLRANSQKKNGRAQSITPVKEPHSRKRARVDQKPDYQSSSEMLQPRNQAHHLDQLIQIPPSVFKTQLDASNPGSLASSASRYSSRDPLPVGSMIESTFQPFDSGAPRLPAQVTKRYSLSLCPYDVAEAGGHSQSDWEIMRAHWAQMPTTNLRASLGLSSAQQSYSIGGSTFTSTNAFSLEKLNEGTNLSTRLFASQEANGALSAVPVDPMFADAQTAQMGITSNDGQGWDVFEPTPMSSLDAAAAFDYLSVNREAL